MADIIGGVFTSHVPAIGKAIASGRDQEPYWKPFLDGFVPVRRWLESRRPDVAVVFFNDHGLNFFLDKMPTFAIGTAAEYRNSDEGWGLPSYRPLVGAPELSWHIVEGLVAEEFDVTICQQMLLDHGLTIPFELCWPGETARPCVVPIVINTVQHPLPSPKRCLALGAAVGRAVASWRGGERVVILGTGGLSHQLEGERAGFINGDFDRFCMDQLAANPRTLAEYSALDLVELAGSQGVELLNWIAARGALGKDAVELSRNYHIPISNTGAATMLFERQETEAEARTAKAAVPAFA